MNVLVYSGQGTTVNSVAQCVATLRTLLANHYAVSTIDAPALIHEPWQKSTSLLIIPGGADLPYCRALNGAGNNKISSFVRKGGKFIGFCAGGYYGSKRVEFEESNPSYAVVGPRELAFYPGICRGTAFPGFVYDSEAGARAVKLLVDTEVLPDLQVNSESEHSFTFHSYYNGGGVFVNADDLKDESVAVIARYADDRKVDGGDAAIVYVKSGLGAAVLTGPHPEFSPKRLKTTDSSLPLGYSDMVKLLLKYDAQRLEFMKSLLAKLGLKVDRDIDQNTSPIPTPLYLTSAYPEALLQLWKSLTETEGLFQLDEDRKTLTHVGENDTFQFELSSESRFNLQSLQDSLEEEEDEIYELDKVIKHEIVYLSTRGRLELPSIRETPYWDHQLYYKYLNQSQSGNKPIFGSIINYAEVVSSTSTMLDKNLTLLRHLPTGFANIGTIQVAGRGRGGNVWVSPIGLLAVSFVVRHQASNQAVAPLVFIQYLASLAIVEAIRGYDAHSDQLDVRLKWPNDIYARNPSYDAEDEASSEYLKLAGVLVNSNYIGGEYLLVIGCGINTANEAPSTSLNTLVNKLNEQRRKHALPAISPFRLEILCAKILQTFEVMYDVFKTHGFQMFESLYYSRWLHSNAVVQLDMYGGAKAVIKGISLDYGMLVVDEIGFDGRPTSRKYTLQPDGNSFDMMKGLLKKKI
ncbi:biotin-protein ligase [Lipomyces oligophaga]|uniref:biotin-protein ligase n=1 Tax=Lipomyces oligophaga TaxID=45792 RepID=UPI0034CFF52A